MKFFICLALCNTLCQLEKCNSVNVIDFVLDSRIFVSLRQGWDLTSKVSPPLPRIHSSPRTSRMWVWRRPEDVHGQSRDCDLLPEILGHPSSS